MFYTTFRCYKILVTLSPYYCKGFAYDVNWNLTASGDGWTETYNLLNLPASAVKNAGSVVERYDYYPYGEKVPVTVANTGNTDYLYTGKESQQSLFGINWYDSAARFQTTDGIFTGIDPLAEKYYHLSPYAYCAGNPVNMIDPTGMDRVPPIEESKIGTPEYYLARNELYKQRTGSDHPYYLSYGYKNAMIFKYVTSRLLSKSGKKWISEVMEDLQKKIEKRLSDKGENATEFEDDFNGFIDFAFSTHPDSYLNRDGEVPLFCLGFEDLVNIVLSPDFSDIFTKRGMTQVVDVLLGLLNDYYKHPGYALSHSFISQKEKTVIIFIICFKLFLERNNLSYYDLIQNDKKEN